MSSGIGSAYRLSRNWISFQILASVDYAFWAAADGFGGFLLRWSLGAVFGIVDFLDFWEMRVLFTSDRFWNRSLNRGNFCDLLSDNGLLLCLWDELTFFVDHVDVLFFNFIKLPEKKFVLASNLVALFDQFRILIENLVLLVLSHVL